MDFNQRPEIRALLSRLDDLLAMTARGELTMSHFLTPAELHIAEEYLRRRGAAFISFGGYPSAERRRVFILPEYMEELSNDESEIDFEEKISEYGYSANITLLKISGSGYRSLGHRDYLGSVLGLGVERDVVGDILLLEGESQEAVIFCDSAIAQFFLSELTFVANDKVKVSKTTIADIAIPQKRTAIIHDTVSAPRLDAVIAALCSLSRDKARSVVESGLVELDFECEERPDKNVSAPALVSVRGYGRYKINSLSDKTRKGRFRLEAEKYI